MAVYEWLTANAERTPDAIAIAAPGRLPLTYARLCAHSEYVAAALASLGLGAGDRIATVLPDGPEAAVALVTITSHAVCAPLDPRCRPIEFAQRLSELEAAAVVVPAGSDSPVVDVARRQGVAVLELTPTSSDVAGVFGLSGDGGVRRPRQPSRDHDLALVLHTSGTTSRSKLVPLTHANVSASSRRVRDALDLAADDRYLNVSPQFYSQATMLTLASLAAGGSVACTPGFSAPHFFDWLVALVPTWYSAGPAVHQAILAQSRATQVDRSRHRLRFIRSAAAALPPLVREGLETLFDVPVIEAYGMTECYPISSNPLSAGRRRAGTAGIAAGTDIAIANDAGEFVPTGTRGEVVVCGPHLMCGYLNESSTESTFIGRWFRTGDQGYLDADGYLVLTGRIKDIINRGGEKILAAEVDDVLLSDPDIEQAATFPTPHPTLGEEVAAAVVVRRGASLTEREIRARAAERLAPFKVPSRVVFVSELPKTPTGKVRRHELAEMLGLSPTFSSHAGHRSGGEASTPVQKRLIAIWAQLLGLSVIGIHENFFELGGNSLLAMQLVAEIEKAFGKFLPLPALLQAPTIEELATEISRDTWTGAWSAMAPIQPRGSKPPLFWVHGDSSNAILPTFLGNDQPLYALVHQSQDGRPARYTTVEAIASHYLSEVRRVRATGPYFLGGFSFGGTVAYEMAQQLIREGETVGLLVMLDCHFPGAIAADPADTQEPRNQAAGVGRHVKAVASLDARAGLRYVTDRATDRLRRLTTSTTEPLKTMWCELLLRAGRPIPVWLLRNYLRRLYLKARDEYRPQPYPGRVIYIKSARRGSQHRTKWAQLAGAFEWHEAPGDHLDVVVLPYAQPWAEKLQSWIDSVPGRATARSEQVDQILT